MILRLYTFFLALRNLYGLIDIVPVFSRGAAGPVVGKADGFLGAAGGSLIDGIIADSRL